MARLFRFGLSGLITTAFGYVAFVVLTRFLPYQAANAASWAMSVPLGFTLNRRFTFGLRAREGVERQFSLFAVGALLQLGVAAVDLALLIGKLGLTPWLAALLNLGATTAFGFCYQSLVTFRRKAI